MGSKRNTASHILYDSLYSGPVGWANPETESRPVVTTVGASLVYQMVKNLPAMQETQV